MFDKKSDYALNKRDKDSIIYISATGLVRLCREDFASEEEFLAWKVWSDGDYYEAEKAGRGYYDYCISLDDLLNVAAPGPSAEDELIRALEDATEEVRARTTRAQLCAELLEQVRSRLTKKQYRRLWLYCAQGMTLEAIADVEGVSHQNVCKSVAQAKKKMIGFLEKGGAKNCAK